MGVGGVSEVILNERELAPKQRGELRATTRWNLQKVLKYRPTSAIAEMKKKAEDHIVRITLRASLI